MQEQSTPYQIKDIYEDPREQAWAASKFVQWQEVVRAERKCLEEGHERAAFIYCDKCELMELGVPAPELAAAVNAFIHEAERQGLVLPVGLIPVWTALKAAGELPGEKHLRARTAIRTGP